MTHLTSKPFARRAIEMYVSAIGGEALPSVPVEPCAADTGPWWLLRRFG
jgi:hypothetical protein